MRKSNLPQVKRRNNKQIPVKSWGGAISGAGSGAGMGAGIGFLAGGPAGAATGAIIGGGIGLVTGGITSIFGDKKRRAQINRQNRIRWAGQERTRNQQIHEGYRADQDELGELNLSNDQDPFMDKGGQVPVHSSVPIHDKSRRIYLESAKSYYEPQNDVDSDVQYFPHSYPVSTIQEIARRYEPFTTSRKKQGLYMDVRVTDENGVSTTTSYDENQYNKFLKDNPKLFKNNIRYSDYYNEYLKTQAKDSTSVSSNTTKLKANGGSVSNVHTPKQNSLRLTNGAILLVNDDGTINGSHEQGDNIPLKRNGEVVAYAEPGEVVVDNTVLSKRLGIAEDYMQLEQDKKNGMTSEINKEQRILPKYNRRLSDKLIPSNRRVPLAAGGLNLKSYAAGNRLRLNMNGIFPPIGGSNIGGSNLNATSTDSPNTSASSGMGYMNIASALGTIGNLMLSNQALNRQSKDITKQMEIADAYRPQLTKPYRYNENVDVSDITSEINRGFINSTSNLDTINDPLMTSALRNTANVNRITALSKVFGERNRLVNDIRNKNVDIIRGTNATNMSAIDQSNQFRMSSATQGLNQMMNIGSQRVANYQGALSEFNSILNDRLMMESIGQRYGNELGQRWLPKSMRDVNLNNIFGTTERKLERRRVRRLGKGLNMTDSYKSSDAYNKYEAGVAALNDEEPMFKSFGGRLPIKRSYKY